jgi:hypothetical protein
MGWSIISASKRRLLIHAIKSDALAGTALGEPRQILWLDQSQFRISPHRWTIAHGYDWLAIFGHLNGSNQNRFAQNFNGIGVDGFTSEAIADTIAARGDGPLLGKEFCALFRKERIPLRSWPNANGGR